MAYRSKLQAQAFVALLRKYITELSKQFVTFGINTKAIMIRGILVDIGIIIYLATRSLIVQYFYSKLCKQTFAVIKLISIDKT